MSAPLVEIVRLGPLTKNRLMTLKRRTGIDNWNILCRWAFCLSLQESDPVGDRHDESGISIEMTWKTFAGEVPELYDALLTQRTIEEGADRDTSTASILLRRHISRGVSRLVGMPGLDDITGLLAIVSPKAGSP